LGLRYYAVELGWSLDGDSQAALGLCLEMAYEGCDKRGQALLDYAPLAGTPQPIHALYAQLYSIRPDAARTYRDRLREAVKQGAWDRLGLR
jgi:hypothetical protein